MVHGQDDIDEDGDIDKADDDDDTDLLPGEVDDLDPEPGGGAALGPLSTGVPPGVGPGQLSGLVNLTTNHLTFITISLTNFRRAFIKQM